MSFPGQPEQVDDFRGKNGAECESFIKSIRKTAWKEGKLQDSLWMANFASPHFLGKALRWHSNLPLDVRQDWFKQEKALLKRWPPPRDESDDEEAEAAVIPTPAAASFLSTQARKSSGIGVMQFFPLSGNGKPMFIAEPDATGQCCLTTEVWKAIRLRWDRSVDSAFRVLEWVSPRSKWLAIHWISHGLSFDQGSVMWARLTVVDPTTLTPASMITSPSYRHFRISVWSLSSEGQTMVVWNDDGKAVELETFITTKRIFIAVDPEAYQKANPDERRGRLVFRPMN